MSRSLCSGVMGCQSAWCSLVRYCGRYCHGGNCFCPWWSSCVGVGLSGEAMEEASLCKDVGCLPSFHLYVRL